MVRVSYKCMYSGINEIVPTINNKAADNGQTGGSNITLIAGICVSLGVNVAVVIGLVAICLR